MIESRGIYTTEFNRQETNMTDFMTYLKKLIWIPTLLLSLQTFGLGTEVGNGGDAVHCRPSTENEFEGYYSLDYLLSLRKQGGNQDIVPAESWEDSKNRIMRNLTRKFPDLANLFEDFTRYMNNYDDYDQPRLWKEAPFGLIDIKDEKIIRKLPKNCYTLRGAKVQIIQTVIRLKRPQILIYEFDPEIYDHLRKKAPLQFSFLMIHEWLWDLTSNVRISRDVNRLLHSNKLEEYTSRQLQRTLQRMGLDLSEIAARFRPVCERSPLVSSKLEKTLSLPCRSISENRLRGLKKLDLAAKNLGAIRLGDFSGLNSLEELNLESNKLRHLLVHTFSGLYRLKKLKLGYNGIASLQPNTLQGMEQLQYLDLSNNRLKSLPPMFLMKSHRMKYINLSENQLEALPDYVLSRSTFQLPEGHCSVDDRNCQISVADNKLKKLEDYFGNTVRAYEINLSNNQLEKLHARFFTMDWKAKRVDLSRNKLKSIPRDISPHEIMYLNLRDNQLTHIPHGLLWAVGLKRGESYLKGTLDLRGNPLDIDEKTRLTKLCAKSKQARCLF